MPGTLSECLIEICGRPVNESMRRRAALHLMDWTGCALIGTKSPAGTALAAHAMASGAQVGPCFAAGAPSREAGAAAFLNGGLGNIFELDDVHRTSILHAGDVVVPAALAVAQSAGANGSTLLDAIVRGYEVAIRVGMAAAAEGYSAWYNSGTCGVFGAAMAAGCVLGLAEDALADALGQAGMQASGIWQCRLEPTYSKQLATAHAARAGVTSAQLAAAGFPGARAILEGELGFFAAYYPQADTTMVAAKPEAPWKILDVSFKPWSACRHAHPAIEAALELRGHVSGGAQSQVAVKTYASAVDFCDNPDPTSDHEARFSLQHCVAAALLRGAPGLNDFTAAARADPDIAALRQRVSLHRDAEFTNRFPHAYGARVDVDGASVTVLTAHGDPENPMHDEELDAKFLTLAEAADVSGSAASEMIEALRDLPGSAELARLDRALGGVTSELITTSPEWSAASCR